MEGRAGFVVIGLATGALDVRGCEGSGFFSLTTEDLDATDCVGSVVIGSAIVLTGAALEHVFEEGCGAS